MADIRHLGFLYFRNFYQKFKFALISTSACKFSEDRTIRSRIILHIFDFRNDGRPPSWIWCDVITNHPRFVFDGLNILLKLRNCTLTVDYIYTLQDIAIFIFDPFCLKLAIHAALGDFLGIPQMNSDIVATPKMTVIRQKHIV